MAKKPPTHRLTNAALLAAAVIFAGSLTTVREGPAPEMGHALISVPAGRLHLRPLGNFSQDGKAISPPVAQYHLSGFEMMKYQVTQAQYAHCVQARACAPVPTSAAADPALTPQTNVNWHDATRYAEWMAQQTGQDWRLPTVEEWYKAAGTFDEAQGDTATGKRLYLDPGARMLAQYADGQTARDRTLSGLQPIGSFGATAMGFADMAGTVWDWTDSCFANGVVDANGHVTRSADYCGVRIAAGAHRAAVISFVRDARVGGCAVGQPPDHLGFRLVRG